MAVATGSDGFLRKNNNINFIRLMAALMVLFSHSYALSGNAGDPLSAMGISFGLVGVDIFFVISGYLVTKSLICRDDIFQFLYSRFLRIYPGLFVAVLFCVLVVGPAFSEFGFVEYFSSGQLVYFLMGNATLLKVNYQLPGVFMSNSYPGAVNGSLWTLPHELAMYFLLFGLWYGAFRVTRNWRWNTGAFTIMSLLLVLAGTWTYLSVFVSTGKLVHVARFISLFFMGSLYYQARGAFTFRWQAGLLLVAGLVFSWPYPKLFVVGYHLSVGYLTLLLAFSHIPLMKKFNDIGDYSYGVYIYAFPVQQAIMAATGGVGVLPLFISASVVTGCLAVVSWHMVESPALALKHVPVRRQA